MKEYQEKLLAAAFKQNVFSNNLLTLP